MPLFHNSFRLAIARLVPVSLALTSFNFALPAEAISLAYDWITDVTSAVENTPRLGPTAASRAYGILGTAMFDAWAAYDSVASGTQLGNSLRRPGVESTTTNKNEALSYAAYRVLSELFPAQTAIFDARMTANGFHPFNTTIDTTTAAGVGNVVAEALMLFRRNDGSNQLGNYADNSGYTPTNTNAIGSQPTINDITFWTPEHVPIDDLNAPVQNFLTAHWGFLTPFALSSVTQLRPPTPEPFLLAPEATVDLANQTITRADSTVVSISKALIGTDINPAFIAQAEEIVDFSANLTDTTKLIAEYWEDGGGTPFPPGHWMRIGQEISVRDHLDLDEDVQLFFALGNAVMDAGIATWEAKRFYDYTRPVRAIRELGRLGLIGDEDVPGSGEYFISAWAGPGLGIQRILATDFITYQTPGGNPSPPFSEHTSGHSAFSAAGAEILRLFTGSDDYGGSVTINPGGSRFEPDVTPTVPITLRWATFRDAAADSGISRLYGGIHFTRGNLEGQDIGRAVGETVWTRSQFFIRGGTTVPESSNVVALLLLGGGGMIRLYRCSR
jgi:hypothetical protein